MEEMINNNVVLIGDFQLERKRRDYIKEINSCGHKNILLDDNGDIVTCKNCNKQLSAYAVLREFVTSWRDAVNRLDRERQALRKLQETAITLKAAKAIQEAWRCKNTAPGCPHCNRIITPEDALNMPNLWKSGKLK